MIFKRLFGRKKQPSPPPDNQEDLIRITRHDRDPAARRDACRQLRRLPELRDLAASDADPGVREVALARYGNLLCGQENGGPDLSVRLEEIATLDDQRILERVALGGQEAELRRAAIARIASPDAICACALEDTLAANRSAAVERLVDKSALERVAKHIGKKDKRVYRAARQKLKKIAEREALPARVRAECEDICEKLERLGRFGQWVQDRALLDLLDRQWAQIESDADGEHRVRYQDLRGRFLRAYEEYRSEHEAQIAAEEGREALRVEYRTLLDELQELAAQGDEAQMVEGLKRIAARWMELSSLPDKEQSSLERKYATIRETATRHLEKLQAIAGRNASLEKLAARAEQDLGGSKPLNRKLVRELVERAKPLLAAAGVDESVARRFAEAREALDERLRRQRAQAEKRLALFPDKLDELAGAIDKGSLREAEPLYRSLVSGIELIELSELPPKAYAETATRLRALTPRLRELQQWRRWGTDQHRQELCIAMEALVADDMRLEAIALRLHDLQMEWKGLDKGGSPVNHPLWERFHAASQRVYERCKPYLEEQAAERAANRAQREKLCRELETFLDQADWERMDWKKAVRAEREMRQVWAAMGEVEGYHRKGLEKRFRSAMRRLESLLGAERDRNQAHKRDLVEQIQALVEEPDLGRAIEETKRLQQRWSTTVPARQKEENRLWQRFRAASDAVFARRREQQETHAAELDANLRRREDLCIEAERLAASGAEADELISALRELGEQWRESEALSVPRQAAAGLEKRWRAARGLVEDRRRQRLEEQRRSELDLLADQATLCERLERALETEFGEAPALAAVEAAWQALPEQRSPALQAAIEDRFKRAVEALTQGGEKLQSLRSSLRTDGERRAELCLQLEILARVDSPPELTKERLQLQVTRLTEHMREGEKDPLEATSRLLQQWYLCGPAPAPEAAALEERFLRARRAIEATDGDREAA